MESLQLYFRRPAHWHPSVYVYAFGTQPPVAETTWPGIEMRRLGNDWYELELSGVEGADLVFNDAHGAQTEDLHREGMGSYELGVGWSTAPPDALSSTAAPALQFARPAAL